MKRLEDFIKDIKGCKIATISTKTTIKLPKKYGIDGVVTKVASNMQVQLNYNYENAVNNRLERQGDTRIFTTQELPWGKWVKGQENKLIEHKGELYLRIYLMKNTKSDKAYFVNGVAATQEQVATIQMYERSKYTQSGTQAEVGLTENQVMPKNVKLSGILVLKTDGQVITPQKQYDSAE
jgi:hypothetical protein